MIAAVLLAASLEAADAPPADAVPAPPELHVAMDASRRASVVEPGVALERVSTSLGRLTLDLTRATVFTVADGSGSGVGVFVQGNGRFRFHAADRTAAESLRASKDRNDWNLKLDGDVVSGEFANVLLLTTRPSFPALEAPTPAPGVPAQALNRETFGKLLREVDRFWLAWDQRLTENRLDPTSGAFAVAYFDAPSPIAWTRDASRTFEEMLFYPFGRPESTLEKRPLAVVPIDGGRGAHPPAFEVVSTAVDLVQDDPNSGFALTTFEVKVRTDGARIARFGLLSLDSILRANNGHIPSWQKEIIQLERVEDASGAPLPASHSWSAVLVDLGPGHRAGETLRITMKTRRKEPGGFVAGRGKGAGGTLEPSELVPTLDNGAPWRAVPFDIRARLYEPYRLVLAGLPEPSPATPGSRNFDVRATIVPEDLGLSCVRDVLSVRGGTEELPVTLAYPPGTPRSHVDRTLDRAGRWSAWFATKLGPFPGPRLDIDAISNVGVTGATVTLGPSGLAEGVTCPVEESFASSELATDIAWRWLTYRARPAERRAGTFLGTLVDYLGEAAIDANDSPSGGSCLNRRRGDWKMAIGRCRWSGPVEAAGALYFAANGECLVGRRGVYGLDLIRQKLGDEAFFGAIRRALESANAAGRSITLDDVARESGAPALFDAVFRRFDATPVLVREGL